MRNEGSSDGTTTTKPSTAMTHNVIHEEDNEEDDQPRQSNDHGMSMSNISTQQSAEKRLEPEGSEVNSEEKEGNLGSASKPGFLEGLSESMDLDINLGESLKAEKADVAKNLESVEKDHPVAN